MEQSNIVSRLGTLGYTCDESDNIIIPFLMDKVSNHIKSNCNLSEIPEKLHEIAIDMVCGEFLLNKKGSGKLTGYNLEDAAVKSIQEGDTNITYAIGDASKTPEQRLDALISFLLHSELDFASYRTIKW